jgi:hypothetical protein
VVYRMSSPKLRRIHMAPEELASLVEAKDMNLPACCKNDPTALEQISAIFL